MLDRVLLFLKETLDSHLRQSLSLSESLVSLNHFHGTEGSSFQEIQNKLVMTLVKLEYDTTRAYYNPQSGGTSPTQKNPPQFFNANILMAANFDNYVESLKIISNVIMFFQANTGFRRTIHPQMPADMEALDVEIANTSDAQSYELWHALGARYVPSIIYKVRRLTVDAGQISRFQSPTKTADVEIGS